MIGSYRQDVTAAALTLA